MLDAYTVRKAIPRVVLAVIAINLSIYLCVAAIDISIIIGRGINSLLVSPFITDSSFSSIEGIEINSNDKNSILGLLGAGGALGGLMLAVWGSVGAVGASIVSLIGLLLPLLITVALISLAVLFTLVIRQGLLIFLTVVSPIAFVLYILPGTEKYFKQWGDLFIRTLAVYPIIAVIFAMSNVMASILLSNAGNPAGTQSDSQGVLQIITAILVVYMPLVLIPFAFKLAGGAMAAVMNATNSRAQDWANKAGQAIREKRKNDEDSWLYKSKHNALHNRDKAGTSGRAIVGGLTNIGRNKLKSRDDPDRLGTGEAFRKGGQAAVSGRLSQDYERLDKNKDMQMFTGDDTQMQDEEKYQAGEIKNRGDWMREQYEQYANGSYKKDAAGNYIRAYNSESIKQSVAARERAATHTTAHGMEEYLSVKRAGAGTDYALKHQRYTAQDEAEGVKNGAGHNVKEGEYALEYDQYNAEDVKNGVTDKDGKLVKAGQNNFDTGRRVLNGEGGIAEMTENISKRFGNDRMRAAKALVMARELGGQAKRVDLQGPGTGGHIKMMEDMHNNGYTGDFGQVAVNKELMSRALKIKSPGEQVAGRGESTMAFSWAQGQAYEKIDQDFQVELFNAGMSAQSAEAVQVRTDLGSAVRQHGEASAQADVIRKQVRDIGLNTPRGEAAHDSFVAAQAAKSGVLEAMSNASAEAKQNLSPVFRQKVSVKKPKTQVVDLEEVVEIKPGVKEKRKVYEEVTLENGSKARMVKKTRVPVEIGGKQVYGIDNMSVSASNDSLKSNPIWRSHKYEFLGGEEEAMQAGRVQQAAEEIAKAAEAAGPQGPGA